MATVYYRKPQKRVLTNDEIMMLERASKMPIAYDEDCPELTPDMERAFAEARRKKPYRGPIPNDLLEKMKEDEKGIQRAFA